MLEDKANERLDVLLKDVNSICILLYRSYIFYFTQNPNDVKLLTLLNVTSLLATCSEGRGRFAEIVCHKIFKVEELVRLVMSQYFEF